MNLTELFHHETDLQTLSAGQILFKEGDDGDLMYVLMSGTLDIFVRDRLVETAEAGAIVGEMVIVDENIRSGTVIAKSDCTLLPIGRMRFSFLTQETPHIALHVIRVMADRLRRADARL